MGLDSLNYVKCINAQNCGEGLIRRPFAGFNRVAGDNIRIGARRLTWLGPNANVVPHKTSLVIERPGSMPRPRFTATIRASPSFAAGLSRRQTSIRAGPGFFIMTGTGPGASSRFNATRGMTQTSCRLQPFANRRSGFERFGEAETHFAGVSLIDLIDAQKQPVGQLFIEPVAVARIKARAGHRLPNIGHDYPSRLLPFVFDRRAARLSRFRRISDKTATLSISAARTGETRLYCDGGMSKTTIDICRTPFLLCIAP